MYAILTKHRADTRPKALIPPEKHALRVSWKRFKVIIQLLYEGSTNRICNSAPTEPTTHLTYANTLDSGSQQPPCQAKDIQRNHDWCRGRKIISPETETHDVRTSSDNTRKHVRVQKRVNGRSADAIIRDVARRAVHDEIAKPWTGQRRFNERTEPVNITVAH